MGATCGADIDIHTSYNTGDMSLLFTLTAAAAEATQVHANATIGMLGPAVVLTSMYVYDAGIGPALAG